MDSAFASADGAGEVLFRALLPGRYTSSLSCPGFAEGEEGPPVDVGDGPLAVTFVVHRQQVIAGILVNEEGAPDTAHASVRVRLLGSEEAGYDGSAWSDDEGRFALRGIGAGTYELTAEGNAGPIHVQPTVVEVKEGEPVPEVRLVVRTRYKVSGQVVDERGLPVSEAFLDVSQLVPIEPWQSPAAPESWSVILDDDGRFEVDGLLPGTMRLDLRLGGVPLPIVSGEHAWDVPGNAPITLVTRLPAGRIEGRILGAGPAWQGARVELGGEAGGASLARLLSIDEDGRFSALVPPDAEVSIEAISHQGETAVAEHVRPGDRVELPVRAAATLQGTVRGAPRFFRVELRGSESRSEVFLGTGGTFEMRGVPALSTAVVVTAPGLVAREEITLSPGETRSLDLTLAPPREEPEDDTTPGGDEAEEDEAEEDETDVGAD
jgi:hypothetical protein